MYKKSFFLSLYNTISQQQVCYSQGTLFQAPCIDL